MAAVLDHLTGQLSTGGGVKDRNKSMRGNGTCFLFLSQKPIPLDASEVLCRGCGGASELQ